MMIKQRKNLVVCLSLFCGLSIAHADWISWNVDRAIPDNNETGLQDTRFISGFSNVIQSVDVRLRLTGDPLAFNGDFYGFLFSEHGGYAVLLNRTGRTTIDPFGYDSNGFDVQFTVGGNDIHLYLTNAPSFDGSGRLTGIWGVDGRNTDPDLVFDTSPRTNMLNSFQGVNPNGNWTLFMADMSQNGTAKLDSWGLNIVAIPEPATVMLFGLGCMGVWLLRRNARASAE